MSPPQTKVGSANPPRTKSSASQDVARTFAAADGRPNVEDVMEVRNGDVSGFVWRPGFVSPQVLSFQRMVHLAVPRGPEGYVGHDGPGDVSQEASGFYGMDTEDRERGEEGGEDQERREEEWEAEEEDKTGGGGTDGPNVPDVLAVNHTTPDLDALIG